ncbi:MAG: hypothetical protein RLZZ562_709 [Planctomycetota bacterium]
MQRNALFFVGLAAVAAIAFAAWQLGTNTAAPPQTTDAPIVIADTNEAEAQSSEQQSMQTTDATTRRETMAVAEASIEDDPEIRAAMCGFKGRIVDHKKEPQARCGVRVYRGAIDTIMRPGFDPFAELPAEEPRYIAGEVMTADDGTFLMNGVWPQGFYLMLAGIGTDAPTHQMLSRTPSPGEVLDLGDIVLNDAAVATGTVLDDEGNPIAGALVMAADIPGQALDFVPMERLDPKGCLLIREKNSPVQVVDFPTWVEKVYEQLPFPMTRSGADGTFRLVGVAPGMNMVAAMHDKLVPTLKKSIKFEAGQTRDVGELRLREGEEVSVKVVDAAGKPVVGAEVVAATTSSVIPVDFASRMGSTDKDGRVTSLGFGRGRATAAARRSPQDPWVLAEPQPTLRDVLVTLPSVSMLHVRVTLEGRPVAEPQLKLLPGKRPNEAFVMTMLGMQPGFDIKSRMSKLEDGRIEIRELPLGHYTLIAKAEGSATDGAAVEIIAGVAEAQIDLKPGRNFSVRVLGPNDVPVRNATIYVAESGKDAVEIPICAGRTDKEGMLAVTDLRSDEGRATAEHPKWGMTHSRFSVKDGEVVLRMQEPGWIDGSLMRGGKPVEAGKYAIAAEARFEWSSRPQAVESVPTFATPALDGTWKMRALQPGKYSVSTIPAIEAMRSPGGMVETMQNAWGDESARSEITVVSGQGVTCALTLDGEVYEGPVGQIFGVVQIDGLPAEGATMQAYGQARRLAKCDAAGRFELRDVPAGRIQVQLRPAGSGGGENLWSSQVEVVAGQSRDLVIDIRTTELRGIVLKPDGSPAANVFVNANGEPFEKTEGRSDQIWRNERTDSEGKFAFERVPEGNYSLQMRDWGNEGEKFRGELSDVRAEAGRPRADIVLRLRASIVVKGRVDYSSIGVTPEWAWMTMRKADPAAPNDRTKWLPEKEEGISVQKDGEFSSNDLDAGNYWATLHCNAGEEWKEFEILESIQVGPGGASGLVLHPQQPAPKPPADGKPGK